MRPWCALLVAAALSGCGTTPPSEPEEGLAPAMPPPATQLLVEQTTDRTQTWTLRCDPPGGDHPDPASACGALASVREPFAPLGDVICTEQYGGAQTARITGTYRGAPVDLALSRTDGCRISQWDRLGAVLPGPVGVEAPK